MWIKIVILIVIVLSIVGCRSPRDFTKEELERFAWEEQLQEQHDRAFNN